MSGARTTTILFTKADKSSAWVWPKIEGLFDFKGTLCHTAAYDKSIDLDGKRVAVLGIGSSGVQTIPNILNKVSKLYTWIRNPTWITAGFGQKYAGENGANFTCNLFPVRERSLLTLFLQILRNKRSVSERIRKSILNTARRLKVTSLLSSLCF